jgi:hypothetical protein
MDYRDITTAVNAQFLDCHPRERGDPWRSQVDVLYRPSAPAFAAMRDWAFA